MSPLPRNQFHSGFRISSLPYTIDLLTELGVSVPGPAERNNGPGIGFGGWLHKGYVGTIQGLYRDNGKENGSYYLGFRN